MAWFTAAIPYIAAGVSAAGTYVAGKQNARALKLQSVAANQQAVADESAVRRRARQILGMQAAATAENGLGYEGSAGLLLDQSGKMAELDALNTRYNGRMRGLGLIAESDATSRESRMLAGQQLISGASSAYTSGARLPNPFRRRVSTRPNLGQSQSIAYMDGVNA